MFSHVNRADAIAFSFLLMLILEAMRVLCGLTNASEAGLCNSSRSSLTHNEKHHFSYLIIDEFAAFLPPMWLLLLRKFIIKSVLNFKRQA